MDRILTGSPQTGGEVPASESRTPQQAIATRRTLSLPELCIAVQGPAAGLPIVLSHALGLDMAMWKVLASELAAAGYRVLCYDHRGHGQSAAPPGPYTMDDLVADAARVIREWDVGPVVWIGLSMGGMVGQGLAIRHPELVRGLVLANTAARYSAVARAGWEQRIHTVEAGGMAAIAQLVVERYLHDGFRSAHHAEVDLVRDKILRNDVGGYLASCHAVARVDWLSELKTIQAPTLIIAGALDLGTPPSMAEEILAEMPHAQLVILETASHLSVAEQPERFAALVDGLLQRIS